MAYNKLAITWAFINLLLFIFYSENEGRYSIIGEANLRIRSVTPEDKATYQCRAENREDSIDVQATIDVVIPPQKVSDQTVNYYSYEKDDVELTCGVTGTPTPQLQWLKNGVSILHGDYFQVCVSTKYANCHITSQETGVHIKCKEQWCKQVEMGFEWNWNKDKNGFYMYCYRYIVASTWLHTFANSWPGFQRHWVLPMFWNQRWRHRTANNAPESAPTRPRKATNAIRPTSKFHVHICNVRQHLAEVEPTTTFGRLGASSWLHHLLQEASGFPARANSEFDKVGEEPNSSHRNDDWSSAAKHNLHLSGAGIWSRGSRCSFQRDHQNDCWRGSNYNWWACRCPTLKQHDPRKLVDDKWVGSEMDCFLSGGEWRHFWQWWWSWRDAHSEYPTSWNWQFEAVHHVQD